MESRTAAELQAENEALRSRIAELESGQAGQKQAERALRETEGRAHALLESPFEAIVVTDHRGWIVSVNARTLEMFGYIRDELLGQPVERLLSEGDRARLGMSSDHPPMVQGLDLTGTRKDGTEFPIDVSLSFSETADGMLFLAFIRDMSGPQQSREALRRSEARAHALLEAASEGIVIVDRSGRVVSVNARAEQLFGLSRRALVGQPLEVVLPERLRELHGLHRTAYFGEPGTRPMGRGLDLVGRRGDGTEFPLEVSLTYIETEDGPQAMAFITDITERLAMERAVRQVERLASLGTLAAGMAHEINNPIGIVSSRIELMLMEAAERGLPGDVVEDLRVLDRNARRVTQIAQSLLSFARKSPVQREPVDLNQVVDRTLLLVRRQLNREGIEIVPALQPGELPVLGHGNALEQVVLNLLTNAREAIEGGGAVRIETVRVAGAPGGVRLTVSDTGSGIPPEVLPHIFDPFYTTKATGTGLGLSVTYGIVRDHNGTIEVQSRPGQGTTFSLVFPEWPGDAAGQ